MKKNILILAFFWGMIPLFQAERLMAKLPPGKESKAVIQMARSHLGGDEKLNNIRTLKYQGTINSSERNRVGKLILYLKKPLKQRIEIRTEEGLVEVTAVNGYEGWIMRKDSSTDDSSTEVRVMTPENLNRMLISTWENLNFFKEPTAQHGKTRFMGKTEYRGRSAYELHVHYPGGSPAYKRYFDSQTGELIGTLTDGGLEFIESGMILVDGLQFPRKIEAFRGTERVHVIKFEKIQVNEGIPDEMFEHPVGSGESRN